MYVFNRVMKLRFKLQTRTNGFKFTITSNVFTAIRSTKAGGICITAERPSTASRPTANI